MGSSRGWRHGRHAVDEEVRLRMQLGHWGVAMAEGSSLGGRRRGDEVWHDVGARWRLDDRGSVLAWPRQRHGAAELQRRAWAARTQRRGRGSRLDATDGMEARGSIVAGGEGMARTKAGCARCPARLGDHEERQVVARSLLERRGREEEEENGGGD